MTTPAPGTFWYDFLTGPALGGIGALLAAIVIGGVTLLVSKHRRVDAANDRAAEHLRTRREEWFRRLQWAQGLTNSDDDDIRAAGFDVIDYLGESDLATLDDKLLLFRFSRTDQLDAAAAESAELVDASEYVLDNEDETSEEDPL